MKRVYLILILGMVLCCGPAGAEERLKLDKTTILGNGELPKVTFVVPWRDAPSEIPELQASPATPLPTTPLDSELYQRQVDYLMQLKRPKGDDTAH